MARRRCVVSRPVVTGEALPPVSGDDRHRSNTSVISNLADGMVNAWAADDEGEEGGWRGAADRNEQGVQGRENEEAEEAEEEEEDDDDEDDDDEEQDYEAILKKNKTEILELLKASNKKLKQAKAEKENEKENVKKTLTKLAKTRQKLDGLQKERSEEVSGLTTTTSEVAAMSVDFSSDNKKLLGGIIRTLIFKKHKITTARSFENGEIQMTLHSHLGARYCTPEMLAAHRDSLVRLVNHELTQRRNHVNNMIMKEWNGMSIAVTVFDLWSTCKLEY